MGQTASGEADDALRIVRITRPFYLGTVEVTQSQWEKVTGRIHSLFYPGPENPITYVSWQDAQEFIAALNKQEAATYRLPTEAEWEFAARGGSKEDFVAGSSPGDLDRMGWFHDNSDGSPHAVGAKSPNTFGLHDMLGNVWEWCQEVYNASPRQSEGSDSATQPSGHQSAACYRIVRGGSFLEDPAYCRVGHRDYYEQSRALKSFGFRVALSLQP
ncbi:MAG: SUMF1/EgtB/PvdO family nonheme iron enzyme [Armatimonadetes bacterium]|nr:SUMF1/EgtB/PvdO family nonheme iron enzyme [Armatimonadota bacterium]